MKTKTRNADIFFQLTRRHLLVFAKNKVRLLYTLLVPVIIFVVYLFFLRGLELDGIRSGLAQMSLEPSVSQELKDSIAVLINDAVFWKNVYTLVDTWMISGIIGLTAITVSLQANTVIVEDKQNGVNRDFASSPIHRNVLIASYFFFNFIVTTIICIVFLLICLIYLACMGELALSFGNFMTIIGVLLLSTVASTLVTIFIGSFIKSEGTLAAVVAVFSTAVGFLIGAYMPLGMLPVWVQGICGFIPGSYSCALLRYGFMSTPIANLSAHLSGVLQPEFCTQLMDMLTTNFGYKLNFFGIPVGEQYQALALAIFIIVFVALNIAVGSRVSAILGMKKKKSKKK
ncbi:MAG: ABC transporter permease [Clostridiales bacterium]|nr:ABC transporter permease [Clostridiales bacterium]